MMPSPLLDHHRRRPSDALFARSEGDAPSRHSFQSESPEDWWVPRELLLYANEQRGEAQRQVVELQHECQQREDLKVDAELGRMRAERKVAALEQRMARMKEEHKVDLSHKVTEAEEGGRREEAAKAAVKMKEMAETAGLIEQRLAGVQARAKIAQKALQSQLKAGRATREVLEKKLAAAWMAQEGHENNMTAQRGLNNGPRVALSTGLEIWKPLPSTRERLPDENKTKKPILPPMHPAKNGQPSRPQNVPSTRTAKKSAAKTASMPSVPNMPQKATNTRRL